MTIAVFGNTLRQETIREVKHIVEFLQLRGVNVVLSQELRHGAFNREFPSVDDFASQSDERIDFALSVGGDGTFLTTASLVGHLDIPILGINCGHLGYLAEVQTKNIDLVLDQLINNGYTIEQRRILEVSCQQDGKIASPYALNEVAILKSGLSSMITVDVTLNGEFLHNYKADGLLVATPTGSTAYSLSVGGPIMVPRAGTFAITPVAPHSLNVRPIVIRDDWEITLEVSSRSHNFLIAIDGRSETCNEKTRITIRRAPFNTRVVKGCGHSFFDTLREKMMWGADTRE